jgi:hypothetical protein
MLMMMMLHARPGPTASRLRLCSIIVSRKVAAIARPAGDKDAVKSLITRNINRSMHQLDTTQTRQSFKTVDAIPHDDR